jgi:hypothetical protein
MKPCQNPTCTSLTENPSFCSRSCSVTVTNSNSPKLKRKISNCIRCGKELPRVKPYKKRVVCFPDCLPTYRDWNGVTLNDFVVKRRYQIHSRIRTLARANYIKAGLPLECKVCRYNTHVDICHIKAIKDHPLITEINVVNDVSNLVALCKNHHWEFDNNLLIIDR